MKLTGAEILCESLLKEGVEVIFGYPGGAIMPVYDALTRYPKLRHILVRHEQGAIHAAEGYARSTGKPAVCLVTSGPGATNVVTGLADAILDSVPVVAISGQVHSHLIGGDAFQETDVVGITAMVTKHNYLIMKASEIAVSVKEAFHISGTGRPGPVVIDITKDAQFEKIEFNYPEKINLPGYNPTVKGNMHQIERAAEFINQSSKPYIFAGHGVLISHAEKELLELSEKAAIPVGTTLHGISCIKRDHPNYIGWLGMHGNLAPNKCVNKADVVIALGMRFDDRVTGRLNDYLPHATIIHVDIDPAELGKNVKVSVPIVGDVKEVLKSLLPLIKESKGRKEWFDMFKDYDKVEYEKVIRPEIYPRKGPLKMSEIVKKLSDITHGKSRIVADVGQHQMIACRYYEYKKHDSFVTSGGLGTMGFALPASIGVKVAKPNDEVWTIVGDGSFQMTMQEMATIAQENLDIKIMLLNNNFLGMVRQWQQLFFDKNYSSVSLKNPDFMKLSEGFGIPSEKVTERKDIEGAIKRARKHKGPYLIEFVVEKEQNIFPMIPQGASVDEIRIE
ncbi:acetolactate synthase, large subunit, biosynthetic type [Candidatus Gottesmanbacteria bacterium RIFCSPHIGHO2_02_FULL_39_11]|uniref:Acetolactate synthase n=1 Tax=Candidatus Gottesmanbacteria bacterium RIFCSPHIGHO2_02_FULL_39_11 TaxID=1798382 RepID=A0A1F5ZSR2_9BACT|nr:MAG: acetolactate synthase, large subunit, biosynthetic type [Candidatus Gottesmanbacteria bacterium RIFCSPHIGHO2_02_FULL_39_11]